jgi:hypothetical protein
MRPTMPAREGPTLFTSGSVTWQTAAPGGENLLAAVGSPTARLTDEPIISTAIANAAALRPLLLVIAVVTAG